MSFPEKINIEHKESSCLLIDGQALVISLGKPEHLADAFVNCLFKKGDNFGRIDVVFDRYRDLSIKSLTQQKRTKAIRPIR